ncbi:MAG: penicillin-binding protein 1C [Chitinophagaceae bacterium]|nr:MAG: penicillin-binding protein 1C [Chitinophagaceae bacterium]
MRLPAKRWKRILIRTGFVTGLLVIVFFILNLLFPLKDKIEYSASVYDDKGELVHAYLTSDQKWRMQTSVDEISPLLEKTLIYKEDRYFYNHPGVNPLAIGRAIVKNIFRMKRTSGASTITMQVARALEPKKRTYGNKLVEVFRALQLELKYSKQEIFRMYINLVPYGGNIEGVKSASILYFRKNPDHLSLAEITALSIIPNRPSSLVVGKNNDRIVEERNRWLRWFNAEKVFTAKEIEDAINEPLTATRTEVPKLLPHLSQKLKKRGGTEIYTNISIAKQSRIEKIVYDYSRTNRLMGIKNAAVIVIDNKTHKIVSYVGSADFTDSTDGGQVNGASAIRQPGSTLKPLVYAIAMDDGLLTPKTIISDVAVSYGGYAPENFDKKFKGQVAMDHALEHSLNIPAVKTLGMVGKDKMIDKLVSCGLKQIGKDQRKLGLSLILGGCGASLEELTGMYSLFAGSGQYVPPALLANQKMSQPVRIISSASTFMINDILSKVNRPDFPLNWQSTEHMPKIAWKTGTSYGRRDAWSIGYNKNYTVGVWLGNFSGTGVNSLSGANTATPLLFRIFNTIDYDSDEEWFTQPADCLDRLVCSETGLPPAEFCSNIISDHFIPMVSATGICEHMKEVFVSMDEKISYCRSCVPDAGYKKKLYNNYNGEMVAWFSENQVSFSKIPPHNPSCEKVFQESGPVILFPHNGSEYLLSKKNPEPLQLSCNPAADVTKVYWYINNRFYKAAPVGSKQFFMPEEGPVKISCTDDKGRNRDINIRVRFVDL